jgi:hypothetical protein
MKKIFNWLMMLLTSRCDEGVENGICDFGGQGRDEFGKECCE